MHEKPVSGSTKLYKPVSGSTKLYKPEPLPVTWGSLSKLELTLWGRPILNIIGFEIR